MKLTVTVTRTAEISTDGNYRACTEKEYCQHLHGVFSVPVARCELFKKKLQRCLGGGPLRCVECLEAQRDTKETFTAGSAEEVERTPGQPHPYRIVKGCDCGYCNEQREKAKEME